MKVTQIATVLNTVITLAQIGEAAVVTEDLSNIVDIGASVLDYTGANNVNYDTFVGKLIDQIGRVMFADRVYVSQAPNILKTSYEYGSVLQKVRCELPDAQDNETWNLGSYPIQNGAAYPDPFEITKPTVDAKFFNGKTTFEVPITFPWEQLKCAFQSASDMSSFFAMIENRIRMKMTLSTDALVMRTIISLMAQKIGSSANVVNLLSEYNTLTGETLTASACRTDANFLCYSAKTLALYIKYLQGASVLYNNGGYVTFTPKDRLKFIMTSEFSKSLDAYLYSNTFHNEFLKLEGFEEVAYWQGTGTSNEERENIDVKVTVKGVLTTVEQSGVVAIMFDEWGAMVSNENYRVTSQPNSRGEYTNYFYKWDAHYMNDINENCVVFVIADVED